MPTTYVWGRHDPALGRAAAHATAHQVSGDYLFVELDAGHWLPELHPDEVTGAVLDRVRPPPGTTRCQPMGLASRVLPGPRHRATDPTRWTAAVDGVRRRVSSRS